VSQEIEPNDAAGPRVCPIADALDIVGERWTLLVLRELGFGGTRFKEIQVNTGAPRETLSLRLRKLEDYRLIERRRYCERPPRDEYVLTPAGQDLQPVLRSLRQWGERYATPAALSVNTAATAGESRRGDRGTGRVASDATKRPHRTIRRGAVY
jgi:DNA-binding HxlR family transcriptional regulator